MLNIIASWNSANGFIFYGKRGEVSTDHPDAQEILAKPGWQHRMTVEDWRVLTPLKARFGCPGGANEDNHDSKWQANPATA